MVADSLIREPLIENYILHIEAYDTGEPRLSAEAEVMVSVAMNHPPSMDIFYEYEILETVSIGSVVGTITVTDPDQNQTLEYFMDDASGEKYSFLFIYLFHRCFYARPAYEYFSDTSTAYLTVRRKPEEARDRK